MTLSARSSNVAKSKKKSKKQKKTLDRQQLRELLLSARTRTALDLRELSMDIGRHSRTPGSDLVWIAAYDFDEKVASLAAGIFTFMIQEEMIPEDVKYRIADTALPELSQALRNPSLSDDRKYPLGAMYVICGGDLRGEELSGFFKDFDAASHRAAQHMAEDVNDSHASLIEVLASMGMLEPNEELTEQEFLAGLDLCSIVCETKPEAASSLLGAIAAIAAEHHFDLDAAEAALEMMAETRCARAAWCLDELARWPGMFELGDSARELAEELTAAGVNAQPPPPAPLKSGNVSCTDNAGDRMMRLTFQLSEERAICCVILLDESSGIKGVFTVAEEEEDGADEALLPPVHNMPEAPCTGELARELLADAWVSNEKADELLPAGLFILRGLLGGAPILPKRRKPRLDAYDPDNIADAKKLLKNSGIIATRPPFAYVLFTSTAAYDYVSDSRESAEEPDKNYVDAFIRRAMPHERDIMLSRMATNLELEALAGRAGEEACKTAALVYDAVAHETIPSERIPFLRRIAEASIDQINTNLALGFTSQEEANETLMRAEEAGVFDDLLDED